MLSSISNSELTTTRAARLTRASWALLISAILLCASAEVLARFGLEHLSRIHGRILQEARNANTLRRSPLQKTVLLLGNSLLLEGVDMQQLRAGLEFAL